MNIAILFSNNRKDISHLSMRYRFYMLTYAVLGDFRTGDFRTRRLQDSGDFRTEERSGQDNFRTWRLQDNKNSRPV